MDTLRAALKRELAYMDGLTPYRLQQAVDAFNEATVPTHHRERQGQRELPVRQAPVIQGEMEPETCICVVRSLPGYGMMPFLPGSHHPRCPAYRGH